MRELLIRTLELPDEQGTVHSYDYSVVIDEMNVGPFNCESYGVKIAQRGGPEAVTPHVTCSASRIDELCELLMRNGVTPAQLDDVVYDWL